jgi:hypothetical protein
VKATAEPLVSETGPDHQGGAWIWETRICYFRGLIYRLNWDDLAHFENEKRYAPVVDDELGATESVGLERAESVAASLMRCNIAR